MGFREVYRVVSVAASQQVLGESAPLYDLKKGQLLDQSVACAVVMVEGAAKHLRKSLDTAYTIGLLHSIGKVVINEYYLRHGIDLYDTDGEEEVFDAAVERRVLGFDHADVGAALLQKWNFPEEIWQPIAHQFHPLEAPEDNDFAALLAIARWSIPYALEEPGSETPSWEGDQAVLDATGLSEEELQKCIENAREGVEEIQQLMS